MDTNPQRNDLVPRLENIMQKILIYPIAAGLLLYCNADKAEAEELFEKCMQEKIVTAPDSMSIGELRNVCHEVARAVLNVEEVETQAHAVETRLVSDKENILHPFTLMSHRQNYILLAGHNFQGYDTGEYEEYYHVDDIDLDDTEVQFQISIKTPLGVNLLDTGISVWSAYTVRSFWQLYNASSPFRETNHEPEIWMQYEPEWHFYGWKTTALAMGFAHQSNGQAANLSRSWNRIYGSVIFEKDNLVFAVTPWYRIPEDEETDDNPDITDYLGHGEWNLAYKYNDHTFSLMGRNNIESGFSRGSVEMGWSFPLASYPYLKGYIQYFSGYGESLIDYDQYVNRIGMGLLLTDLL